MNIRTLSVATAKARAQPGTGFLYGWLLVALFVEYARPASEFTFLDFPFFYSIVPMSLLLVTMFAPGLRTVKEIFSDRLAKWVFIVLGLVTLSLIFADVYKYSSDVFTRVLGYALLFVMIARLVTSESRIRGVIITLFIAHMYLLAMNPDALLNPQERNYIDGATFLGDGNDFALSLCVLFPCMFEVAQSARRLFLRLLAWGGVMIIVFAIIATQSRGGTLGLIAVMSYLWWRSPKKLAAALTICLIGVGALMYAPAQYFARMETMGAGTRDGSAQARIDAWKSAIGMGLKNPILGVGTGHFGSRLGMTAHSTYMLALAELGPFGMICIVMLVFGNIRVNNRLRTQLLARAGPNLRHPARESARIVDLLSAGMVGFAVAGAFLSATYYPHIYVLTALMLSARLIAAEHLGIPPMSGQTVREHIAGTRRIA